jgi:hypothetical protein
MSIAREFRKKGLITDRRLHSARELCENRNGRTYLKVIAYRPTGIALGCPLPDKRFARRIWRISRLIEEFLAELAPNAEKTFAHVPPEYYHITLLNRTHFESDRLVTSLTAAEKSSVTRLLDSMRHGPVIIHLNQLILTNGGRLMIPGFPADDSIYEIRESIAAEVPALRNHLPAMAHIKLGHILCSLAEADQRRIWQFVSNCGWHISARLAFNDVYTPLGRIQVVG